MKKPTIHTLDLARFHRASRLVEDDLEEAYAICRQKYGPDVAGVLIVAILRQQLNDKKNQWPPPDDLEEKVNKFLMENGLVENQTENAENAKKELDQVWSEIRQEAEIEVYGKKELKG